ncbi:MAG: hypothetical protein K8R25_16245, partial [Methanosarcinales archaeon]|nr:hypothetical protein [Methanosarcinales archaeon]
NSSIKPDIILYFSRYLNPLSVNVKKNTRWDRIEGTSPFLEGFKEADLHGFHLERVSINH